jgi:hypothetical protein
MRSRVTSPRKEGGLSVQRVRRLELATASPEVASASIYSWREYLRILTARRHVLRQVCMRPTAGHSLAADLRRYGRAPDSTFSCYGLII